MRKFIISILILFSVIQPVSALEYTAPDAPDQAREYMPKDSTTFSEDLWYIVKKAIATFMPSISEAAGVCVSIITLCMLVSILNGFSSVSSRSVEIIGIISISVILLIPSKSLITMGIETAESISEYGKLLLPIIASSMAAQGGTTTSAALYTGTVLFNTILIVGITKLLVPLLYAFMALSIAKSVILEPMLDNFHKFFKWLMTWTLKLSIYIFTGYLGITGVISGSVDAAAIKATKIAISGFVPVVGNIISDASETVLVSAGLMKSAVGTYGLLTIIALWIGPFIQIGIQYLILKVTGAVSSVFGNKQTIGLIDNFSSALGFLVAMTGTVCLLFFVSTVCFMKGFG